MERPVLWKEGRLRGAVSSYAGATEASGYLRVSRIAQRKSAPSIETVDVAVFLGDGQHLVEA